MNIDLRTLALLLSITSTLQVVALFVQYRADKTRNGLGWWALGGASGALAFLFNFTPSLGPLAVVANNALYISGLVLPYIGVLRFFGQRERRGWLTGFCALIGLALVYFTYLNNDLNARRLITSLALTAFSFLIARVFFEHKTRPITTSAHFLATVFLVYGAFFAARALATLAGAALEGVFTPTRMQTALYLVTLIASTLWTLGIIILVNQRLLVENREARENAELIFNASPDAVLITRLSDNYLVSVNDGFFAISGFTRAEVIGKSTLEVNIWENPADRQKVLAAVYATGVCENLEAVFRRKDGSQLIAIISAKIITLQGAPHIISIAHDITERKCAEAAQRESEKRYRLLADHANDVIWTMTPFGEFTYVSPSVFQMRGFTPEEVLRQPLEKAICPGSLTAVRELFSTALEKSKTTPHGHTKYFEIEQPRKDGTTVWTEATARVIYNEAGEPLELVSVSRDITERKRLKEELQQQATTDELTGIFNRRHFLKLALNEIRRALRFNQPLTIALIDIDYFKSVNDTYGHLVGDQTLKAFTKICQANIREIDVFARFGGDEFILLFPKTVCEQAYAAIERVRVALATLPLDLNGKSVSITISSGITGLLNEQDSFDTLLSRADQALYQAKAAGRNSVVVKDDR